MYDHSDYAELSLCVYVFMGIMISRDGHKSQ